MAYCAICGDTESDVRYPDRAWWAPDDGWRWGALCSYCRPDAMRRKPRADDYAYEKRGEFDVDAALAENDEL